MSSKPLVLTPSSAVWAWLWATLLPEAQTLCHMCTLCGVFYFEKVTEKKKHLRQTRRPGERLHAGSREVTLVSICESSEPPGLVLFKQHLDQVSVGQVQLLWPA